MLTQEKIDFIEKIWIPFNEKVSTIKGFENFSLSLMGEMSKEYKKYFDCDLFEDLKEYSGGKNVASNN